MILDKRRLVNLELVEGEERVVCLVDGEPRVDGDNEEDGDKSRHGDDKERPHPSRLWCGG
jgi:hypothetical protein